VLRRYLQTLLILIPFGVGLAAAGGAVIARKALHPVDAMTAAARRITAEDLHQRIRRQGSQDELDRLAETLNGTRPSGRCAASPPMRPTSCAHRSPR
jgi:nitrate/nitrite-specific signal transduction histidine kinase